MSAVAPVAAKRRHRPVEYTVVFEFVGEDRDFPYRNQVTATNAERAISKVRREVQEEYAIKSSEIRILEAVIHE